MEEMCITLLLFNLASMHILLENIAFFYRTSVLTNLCKSVKIFTSWSVKRNLQPLRPIPSFSPPSFPSKENTVKHTQCNLSSRHCYLLSSSYYLTHILFLFPLLLAILTVKAHLKFILHCCLCAPSREKCNETLFTMWHPCQEGMRYGRHYTNKPGS